MVETVPPTQVVLALPATATPLGNVSVSGARGSGYGGCGTGPTPGNSQQGQSAAHTDR